MSSLIWAIGTALVNRQFRDRYNRHTQPGVYAALVQRTYKFYSRSLADGKILIHTMSVKEFGEVGAMAQVVMKFAAQKGDERRDIQKSPRPIFLHVDEFQTLITSADSSFATTCRSKRSFVLLTQTLPTIHAALGGGDKAKQEISSLVSNLNLKILCANSDPDTTKWAAELSGRVRQFTINASTRRLVPIG